MTPKIVNCTEAQALSKANASDSGWIPVSEALPNCDANVLVFSHDEKCSVGWLDTDESWVRTDGLGDPVVAWQPLPVFPRFQD